MLAPDISVGLQGDTSVFYPSGVVGDDADDAMTHLSL